MFIAMNRFKIVSGKEQDFEEIWRGRDSHLQDVPGFNEFHLVRGPATDEYTLYATHVIWDSAQDFENWTRSEAFRKAHAGAGGAKGIYLDRPQFEGFEVVMEERRAS